MRFAIPILVLAFSLFWPVTPTRAGAPVGGGTTVSGKCWSGPIATPGDVASAAEWTAGTISTEIRRVGTAITDAVQRGSALQKAQSDYLVKSLQDLFTAQAVNDSNRRISEGISSTRAQTFDSCSAPEKSGSAQVSAQAEKAIQAALREKFKQHGRKFQTDREMRQWAALQKDPSLAAETIMPDDRTISSANLESAGEFIKMMANPNPTPELTDQQKMTEAGMAYTQARNVAEARRSISSKAMAYILSMHAPTMELGSWAQALYEQMGGSGTPPGVVDGKLSSSALISLETAARYANPNWYLAITDKSTEGLLREQLHMQAVQMEMSRRQLDLNEMILALLASAQAAQVETTQNDAIRAASQHVTRDSAIGKK